MSRRLYITVGDARFSDRSQRRVVASVRSDVGVSAAKLCMQVSYYDRVTCIEPFIGAASLLGRIRIRKYRVDSLSIVAALVGRLEARFSAVGVWVLHEGRKSEARPPLEPAIALDLVLQAIPKAKNRWFAVLRSENSNRGTGEPGAFR